MTVHPVGPEGAIFAAALRRALAADGLSLTEVSRRAAAEGMAIDIALVASWVAEQSVPVGPDQLRVVVQLERLLHREPGELISQLVAPRPRRQRLLTELDEATYLARGSEIRRILQQRQLRQLGLNAIEIDETTYVDADRLERVLVGRETLSCGVPQQQRFPIINLMDEATTGCPKVDALSGCRVVHEHRDTDIGLVVAELSLDRSLIFGEEAEVCYRVNYPPISGVSFNRLRSVLVPAESVTVRVVFDERALPERVFAVLKEGGLDVDYPIELVDGVATVSRAPFGPGVLGVTWDWGNET